jgi:hypothetical protein
LTASVFPCGYPVDAPRMRVSIWRLPRGRHQSTTQCHDTTKVFKNPDRTRVRKLLINRNRKLAVWASIKQMVSERRFELDWGQ